jgi:hypothetical protein
MYLIICPLKFLYEKVNESSQNESPLFSPIKNIFPLLGYGDWLNKPIHPSNPFRIIILAKAASNKEETFPIPLAPSSFMSRMIEWD